MNTLDKIHDLQVKISSINSLLELSRQYPKSGTLDVARMEKDKAVFVKELQELKSQNQQKGM